MIFSAAIRQSDGLVASLQGSRQFPSDGGAALVQNAITKFGGVAADWLALELSPAVLASIVYAGASRQFATLNSWQEQIADETITFYEVTALAQSTPPAISQDKAQIINDGADSVTFTADVGDAGFSGPVTWVVTGPDGSRQSVSENAVAGISTLEFLTNDVEGVYRVTPETELQGAGKAAVEVV